MSDISVNPQNIMNLETASQGATNDQRPLLLLQSDLVMMHEAAQKGIPLSFLAPMLTPNDLNELWPNGYREVHRFLVAKEHISPWDTLKYALTPQEFFRMGLELTLQKGPLFWTIYGKNQFHLIICAFKRIDHGTASMLQANLPTFQPKNNFPICVEDLNKL